MKLCICQYGHSRSAALVRLLHKRGMNAIAIGAGTASLDLIRKLSEMADEIFILEPAFSIVVPATCESKVVVFDVGRDQWSNPYHPELLQILETKLAKHIVKS